jgi:ABC-type transport system involved in multi-copper enzyme maturation permease subunit
MMHWYVVGAVPTWISNWLTPVWLLGAGALVGLVLLLILWGVAYLLSRLPLIGDVDRMPADGPFSKVLRACLILFSRRTVAEVPAVVREGPLWPLFLTTVGLAAFGVLGTVFVTQPLELLASLGRLPFVGTETVAVTVPVSEPEDPTDRFSELSATELSIPFRRAEIRSIVIRSNQELSVATRPFIEVTPGTPLNVLADEELKWSWGAESGAAFVQEDVEKLYIRNLGGAPASVSLTIETAPPYPQVLTIPLAACAVALVFLLYLFQQAAAPRMSAVALATYKSETAQPLFSIIMWLGGFLLALFVWIPYNTFGEDIKMLKDSGLTLVMILGIIQAVWAASQSISEEIEGRTALSVLSKPIGRRSFIFGKFLGIIWTVAQLFVILGIVLLIAVAYKPIYDGRESATQDITWQICHMEMMYTVPGLVLAFMETVVLAALSVAISTRLPLLANFVICFAIYLLGHLIPLIVQSSAGQLVFVQFFGQLIGTVLPVLDHFNIQAAVAAGAAVPYEYLAWTFVYCTIFSVIAMLLALVLFEDRDLA